ncbi:MAG TPA: phospho-N-acetylmuramoyl-pentapeptide-transferase [Clostridia bacterium]|nr:phospho-N-acetylmuramoyl-pentapeptide-transferase [Clostridia bacterium]
MNLIYFAVAFAVSLVLCGITYAILKKTKAKQEILEYVTEHSGKSGTPTMGGIGFLLAFTICSFLSVKSNSDLAIFSVIVTCGFGVIGFLDDFIKIKFKRNLGLRAYQKILAQLLISVIVAIYVLKNPLLGGEIKIPFANLSVDIGGWIFPLTVFIFLSCVNGVNLTDGLDGLASSVTLVYLIFFCILTYIEIQKLSYSGYSILAGEYENLMRIGIIGAGVLTAFLVYNAFPAKVFMGDVGSLALGSLVACLSIFTRISLYIPVLGIMYVVSCVSVILQVGFFKITKGKRIFLMAPYHHHLQKKGLSEPRVCIIYTAITAVFGSVLVALAAM